MKLRHLLGTVCLGLAVLAASVPAVDQSAFARASKAETAERRAVARKIRDAAEAGDAKAMVILGYMHAAGGMGVRRSYKDAAQWWQAATDQKNPQGTYYLGKLYMAGKGVEKDEAKGVSLFRTAAGLGESGAMAAMGWVYRNGTGIGRDLKESVKWFQKSHDAGSPEGMYGLGGMYVEGMGVSKDPKKGFGLIHQAAERGHSYAMLTSAALLAEGVGTGKNMEEAYFWAWLADDRDIPKADKLVEGIGKQLSAGKRTEIEARAAAWKPNRKDDELDTPDVEGGGKGDGGDEEDAAPARGKGQKNGSAGESAAATGSPANARLHSTGTGFYVSADGHLLTNNHVAGGCSRLEVRDPASGTLPVTLLATDPRNDLALLKANKAPKITGLFRSGPVRQAEAVMVYGFPLSGALSSTGNSTTGNITALSGLKDDTRFFQISAPVQPGNSGGPMVDQSGNVIGVIVSKLDAVAVANAIHDVPQNVNFAIKLSVATSFLETHQVNYSTAPLGDSRSAPDLNEKVKAFTVQVSCYK